DWRRSTMTRKHGRRRKMDDIAAMMDALEFGWRWAVLFLPLPVLLRLSMNGQGSGRTRVDSGQASNAPALLMPQFGAVRQVMEARGFGQAQHRPPRWRTWVLFASWCLLCIAMTRPQWHGEPVPLDTTARDMMLTVDISPSMQEPDMV